MIIEVTTKQGGFELIIDHEIILQDKYLSVIMSKIEAYLKLRFLKETEKAGFSKVIDWIKK